MADHEKVPGPHAIWTGIIAFGLVSIPVSLFPAHTGSGFSLRMVDSEGNPLRRQYFCEREETAIERDEIVRGYEVDTDQYVVVEDDELEALAPEKSQEINLSRFVALAEVNPVHFERAYFLVPDKGATKAYRLLAKSMQDEQRAGIATFVMRDKEYLVAIVAQQGILRAETMRFHDEIRTPEQIGLPEPAEADSKLVKAFRRAIKENTQDALNRDDLTDTYSQRLREYAEEKYRSGQDVKGPPEGEVGEDPSNVIDLMQVLKQRLQGQEDDREHEARKKAAKSEPPKKSAKRKKATGKAKRGDKKKTTSKKRAAREQLQLLSREELYEKAKSLDIPGRSSMSKPELIEALKAAV
jgi:DNA end-binding protein Ku